MFTNKRTLCWIVIVHDMHVCACSSPQEAEPDTGEAERVGVGVDIAEDPDWSIAPARPGVGRGQRLFRGHRAAASDDEDVQLVSTQGPKYGFLLSEEIPPFCGGEPHQNSVFRVIWFCGA
jgi:hypothetical protein